MHRLFLTAATLMTLPVGLTSAGEFVYRHENVLGTSLELRIHAETEIVARQAEAAALGEIDRLAAIFSRHDADSELMRWQRGELDSARLSGELVAALKQAELWRQRTNGAFDIRAEALTRLWEQACRDQRLPGAAERLALTKTLRHAPWSLAEDGAIRRSDDLPLSLDALAKGRILDAMCELVSRRFPAVTGLTVNSGGDLRKLGDQPLPVSIASPVRLAEGDRPLTNFTQAGSLSLATSGGYRRFLEIGGRRYSHLFDPRSGFPASQVLSASVIAPNAMDADAAATALCVLGGEEGLRLVEALPGFACLIQTADGKLLASADWPGRPVPLRFVNLEDEAPKPGLTVDFTLARPTGGRYRRPYVAVWLEDSDGYPVKTAVLWLQTDQPGPRWHRDLLRWHRNDRVRKLAEETELIGTISGATRGPGDYQARFDGLDNIGQPLPKGKYTLCLEATREHGTYRLIRQEIELGDQPIARTKLAGNEEISAAAFSYVPWAAEK